MTNNLSVGQKASQSQVISHRQQESLRILELGRDELKVVLQRELETNPLVAEFAPDGEACTVSDLESRSAEEALRESDYPDDYDPSQEFVRASAADTEALERRQRLFDRLTCEETLEAHLLGQLNLSDAEPSLVALARTLVCYLDGNGYFCGSFPDLTMLTGEDERRMRQALALVRTLDPPGCGATGIVECLLAQLDAVADPLLRLTVEKMVRRHLAALGSRRPGERERVRLELKVDEKFFARALQALLALNPSPGSAFARAGGDVRYVEPEIRAVPGPDGFRAEVDDRDVPELHLASRYVRMLENPETPPEVLEYVKARKARVEEINEAIRNRSKTIRTIAQAVFDAQRGFFAQGLKGLKPLQMQDIANRAKVSLSTVSRAVNNKYVATPRGTLELRRFFVAGVTTATGEQVSKDRVMERLEALVEGEDPRNPLSDDRLSALLASEGFPVARRTVAKYRGMLGLPGVSGRRAAAERAAGNG